MHLADDERRAFMACVSLEASRGDAGAMCVQGMLCSEAGRDPEAASWLELSALAGSAEAMREMAMVYRHGRGREKHGDAAEEWLQQAVIRRRYSPNKHMMKAHREGILLLLSIMHVHHLCA